MTGMTKLLKAFSTAVLTAYGCVSQAATPMVEKTAGEATAANLEHQAASVEPLSYGNAISVIFSLLLVLGILFACAWVLRRGRGVMGVSTQKITVTSQLSLGVKEKILLLRVGEENVLVGYAGNTLTSLHAWQGEVPPDVDHPAPVTGFSEYLAQLRGQGDKR